VVEARSQHPFWMYEEIQAQPDTLRAMLAAQVEPAARLAAALRARRTRRVIFAGTGTSFHAAVGAAWLARLEQVPVQVHGVYTYDLATYPSQLARDDAVVLISHRGTKRYTGIGLSRALEAGAQTILVTGQGPHQAPPAAKVLRTCHQDRSSAHTVSYTSALALLALLLATYDDAKGLRRAVEELPLRLSEVLRLECAVQQLAQRFAERRRIYFVGGGPHAVTAAEAALKVKETSYIVSEGFALEQMLHGPLQAIEPGDVVVAIAPHGRSVERINDMLRAVQEIGADSIIIASQNGDPFDAGARLDIPGTAESLSLIVSVVPLQLFAYYSAVARQRNPDGFRLDDARYKSAASRYEL
jgi:glutamine---fructose-6-phosphate transaminase (isomerizing)